MKREVSILTMASCISVPASAGCFGEKQDQQVSGSAKRNWRGIKKLFGSLIGSWHCPNIENPWLILNWNKGFGRENLQSLKNDPSACCPLQWGKMQILSWNYCLHMRWSICKVTSLDTAFTHLDSDTQHLDRIILHGAGASKQRGSSGTSHPQPLDFILLSRMSGICQVWFFVLKRSLWKTYCPSWTCSCAGGHQHKVFQDGIRIYCRIDIWYQRPKH